MRKLGIKVGSLLLIFGALAAAISLLAPVLAAGRVRLEESAFGLIPAGAMLLLGANFVILSTIFAARARKVASACRERYEPEGILFFEEDVRGSTTFRNFHAPGRYSSWRKVAMTSLVILTEKTFVALKGSNPIINVPLGDERLRKMTFSLEGDSTLAVAFDANLFQSDWSGQIEYRFKTPDAARLLALLSKAVSP